MQPNSQSYRFVSIAKGIGILLVIAGHFTSPRYMPESYLALKDWIYTFHMPLFMILSGFLFQNSLARASASGRTISIPHFLGKKFKRLMVPYFSISLLIAGTNFLLGHFLTVREPVTLSYLLRICYENVGGSAVFLWFIYTLFLIFLLAIITTRLPGGAYLWTGIAAVVLLFAPLPGIFYLSYVGNFLIYFYLGMCLFPILRKPPTRPLALFLIAVAVYTVAFLTDLQGNWGKVLHVLRGTCGTLSVVYLSCLLFPAGNDPIRPGFLSRSGNVLSLLGKYSAHIYLFHMAGVYAVRLLYEHIGLYNPASYFAALLLALILGVLIPLFLVRYFIQRNRILAFLTGGV